jgi:hypothetical protein
MLEWPTKDSNVCPGLVKDLLLAGADPLGYDLCKRPQAINSSEITLLLRKTERRASCALLSAFDPNDLRAQRRATWCLEREFELGAFERVRRWLEAGAMWKSKQRVMDLARNLLYGQGLGHRP